MGRERWGSEGRGASYEDDEDDRGREGRGEEAEMGEMRVKGR